MNTTTDTAQNLLYRIETAARDFRRTLDQIDRSITAARTAIDAGHSIPLSGNGILGNQAPFDLAMQGERVHAAIDTALLNGITRDVIDAAYQAGIRA